ncbi:hypothetical protein JCM16303_004863 [Sporobolomyces ruberrimus]
MVALTAKTLGLPHLSLSRTSSPSRSNSLNSNPPTPSSNNPSPTSTAPTSPAVGNTPTSTSFFSLDRKRSKSTSPKNRPVDNLGPVEVAPLPPSAPSANSTLQPAESVDKDKVRRTSFGASLSAFSNPSARSISPATRSSTLPAGLSLTPASAQLLSAQEHTVAVGGGGGTPTGLTNGGFKPLQAAIAKSAGVVKDRGGALLMRSKSSDRAEGIAAAAVAANLAEGAGASAATKKKGVMGTVRGLALGQSVSQPAQSRSNGGGGNAASTLHHPVPVRSSSSLLPPPHSGSTTPSHDSQSISRPNSQVHQLAESHVSQISLRMSETVNKVFMPSAHGIAGQQADKLEGTFFVPSSAVQEATGGKGRPCPRVMKSREFGEMLVTELQAAVHDSYLLRTILRSSVLKALSLFLSRLSALLLVPSSPNDPAFNVPLSLSLSKDPKNQESDGHFASNFPLALRYNLHIVRCAITVKQYLLEVAARGGNEGGMPSFVEETLRPWRGKLTELIGRVMNPVVASYKAAIVEACKKSRIEGGIIGTDGAAAASRGRANSGGGGISALGLNVNPRSATQGRSLSIGRSSTPVPLALSSTSTTGGGGSTGPAWLQEAGAIFDVCSRLFARLEAKTDTDRWAVGVAIAATWKGMLGCSARIISEDGLVTPGTGSAPSTSTSHPALAVPPPVKNRLLGGVKKTPSPPPSPPLPPVNLGVLPALNGSSSGPSPATVAFVRLISDLELFENRLTTFLTSTLSSPRVVFHPSAAPVDSCPGAPSCGLCKTGRTFDEESDSSDEDADDAQGGSAGAPGKESRLALSAMREAMQALSSMIIVVRASRDLKVIEEALQVDSPPGSSPQKPSNAPLTPSDLFALGPAKPTSSSTNTSATPSAASAALPGPAHPLCPTLRSAIIDLHPLILLHLVLSRLPRSLPFRLPHEIWALRGGWDEYENELRGFAAGEEWAGEVAWEVRGELVKTRQQQGGGEGLTEREKESLKVLEETVERVSRDSA